MRVTVCEIPNYSTAASFAEPWWALAEHVGTQKSDLVLLPEMPFDRWLAADRAVDPKAWERAVEQHRMWCARLGELGAPTVVTSRPVLVGRRRLQESVVWSRTAGLVGPPHHKRYLPDEPGFWEATWYDRGPGEFAVVPVDGMRLGLLICTEVWFSHHARAYGRAGAHLIATPRASTTEDPGRWLAGGRTVAVVSGAYGLSSNFTGPAKDGRWSGLGWVIDPDGAVLGTTSSAAPYLTVEIDLQRAVEAKATYPRYVQEH